MVVVVVEPVAHEEADPLGDRPADSAKFPSRDLSRLTAGPRQHHNDHGLPFWGCFGKSVRNEQSPRAPTGRSNRLPPFREPFGAEILPISGSDSTLFRVNVATDRWSRCFLLDTLLALLYLSPFTFEHFQQFLPPDSLVSLLSLLTFPRQSLTRAPNVWKKGAIDVAASEVTGLFELIQPERSRCCTGSVTFPSGSTLHLEPIYSRLPGVMMHRIFSRDVVFPS